MYMTKNNSGFKLTAYKEAACIAVRMGHLSISALVGGNEVILWETIDLQVKNVSRL